MLTIGTAGHIDHGKSSLVKALTSIDPDRLPEEKKRGMTIDLGFAWLQASSGEMVGIVDVPGHEHFVRNVIPGLGGIDAALLVIAADDGWMPQTEEHVQILDMLGVKDGIVALTKTDLIDDPNWLELVEKEIAEKLAATSLRNAPVIKVSSKSGSGIQQLKEAIEKLVLELVPRKDIGKPRLSIDRVFTMKGSGVVVTGTLINGSLSVGDDVFISPGGQTAHIRSIESYKQQVSRVQPGSRVALNLTGAKKPDLERGDIIMAIKGGTSRIVNIELRLIPRLVNPLKTNSELVFYLETRELLGRIILFGKSEVPAAGTAFAQIRLNDDVATYIGEHFIVRRQSPAATIGGGIILDPLAAKFRVKSKDKTIAFLGRRRSFELEELVLTELEKNKYAERREFLENCCYSTKEVSDRINLLQGQNRLMITDTYIIDSNHWQRQKDELLNSLRKDHKENPLKRGLSQSILQNQLDLPKEAFNQMIASLAKDGKIDRQEEFVYLSSHKPELSSEQDTMVSAIMELFKKNASNSPKTREVAEQIPGSEKIIRFMLQQNILIELPDNILLENKHYEEIEEKIVSFLEKKGEISIQDINSLFGFSRKYIIPLLQYMDIKGITRRKGNVRILAKKQR
ncbi:MAG: selenocysteine-specific translation elongation factor [Chloroflexota bacterium]